MEKVLIRSAAAKKETSILFHHFLPLLSALFCLAVDRILPMHDDIMVKNRGYFHIFMIISCAVLLALALYSMFSPGFAKKFRYRAAFIAVAFLLLNLYNLVTEKLLLLPQLYFPFPDKILNVFIGEHRVLLKCLLHSTRLQFIGLAFGVVSGFLTGLLIGWSKKAHYWINPLVKLMGPIPSTAWIPITLVAFPTTFGASVFLVALSVWFPVTVQTSSGIQNAEKAYFEVASTLGASTRYQIAHVAVPAALPSIFLGLFSGVCSSFITLMTAEMLGVKYGIGWYVNWQREIMSYANVYAGLIIVALFCYLFITLLFKFRSRWLAWQKGVIQW
ncbi:MAG: ABC transporter permease subunit [Clostridiales bacterium]